MKEAIQKLETEAQKTLQHPHAGKSPFAGSLRSALSRAVELAGEHDKWLAANPEPKAEPKADGKK